MTSNSPATNSPVPLNKTSAQTSDRIQSPVAPLPATGRSSYASATKNSFTPNASDSTTNMAVAPPVQIGGPKSESPVNGKAPTIPVVPNVNAGPTIVNGSNALNTPTQHDHKRGPSVSISSAAVSNFGSNGGPAPSNIQFGDIERGSSPAALNPTIVSQPASATASLNPRSISPQPSPSPIPQPSISGGRPPSTFSQGNGLNFGSFGSDLNDSNVSFLICPNPCERFRLTFDSQRMRPISQNQLAPGMSAIHLRRDSSHSSHGDPNIPAFTGGANRGAYAQGGGRGRGGFNSNYANQLGNYASPGQSYRPLPNARGGPNMQASYYSGRGQAPPGSPFPSTRSPALTNANPVQPQIPPQYAAGMPAQHFPGYNAMGQQHVNHRSFSHPKHKSSIGPRHPKDKGRSSHFNSRPQNLSSAPPPPPVHFSSPRTPFVVPATLQQPPTDLSPESGNFEQFLTWKNQGYMQPMFDPNTGGTYYQPYGMPAQMHPGQGFPPASPRLGFAAPTGPYVPQYPSQQMPQNQAQPLSRTSSQISATDRPASSMGQPPTPSLNAASQNNNGNTGNRVVSTPAPNKSNFTAPARSKGIVIKDPTSGVIKTFEKQPASPARATPSPVKVPTPVPSNRSVSETSHTRTESISTKTDEEKKKDMQAAVAAKIAADEEAKQMKEEAEKLALREKEEAEAREQDAAKAKAELEAEQKRLQEAKEAKIAEEEPKEKAVAQDDNKKGSADFDLDALEAEIAALEAAEAAAEAEYQKKRQAEKEAQARKEAEEAAAFEANMKNAEREAEEAEEVRESKRKERGEEAEAARKAFTALKVADEPARSPSNGSPAVATPEESGTATPVSGISMGPPPKTSSASKRPAALKLETSKQVEPPQPTPAMKALQSARFLNPTQVAYPSAFASPNPALNRNAPSEKGFKYNKEFLLQFQNVFKEKPSLDWDAKVRDTLGDGGETSARPQSARTPSGMGARSGSNRPSMAQAYQGMGSFGAPQRAGPAQLPPGTTSDQRFAMSNAAMGRGNPMPPNPFQQWGRPQGIQVGGPNISRQGSSTALGGQIPQSPRPNATRNTTRNASKHSKQAQKKEEEAAKAMPLTASSEVKPLTQSTAGWKPISAGQSAMAGPPLGDNHLAPDVVQRKVKSHLNKMAPEKFDRISDQILEIVSQSKNETDGRTLRQVIQLTFEKATDEAHWAPMYAKFCKRMLESMSAEIKDENIHDKQGKVVAGGNLFRKYLLNRCQEEFERGWKVNMPDKAEGAGESAMMSDEYYEATAAKRRGLGLVKFIGELFKLQMLTERIMHECVKKLLDYDTTPEEAEVESLTSLLRTIGWQLDNTEQKGRQMVDAYFHRIDMAVKQESLPSRLKFMLMDIVDLRRRGWISKDDNKGPKTLQEIHAEEKLKQQEAELERQRNQVRGGGNRMPMGRGDARNFSSGYGQMPQPDNASSRLGTEDLRRLGNRASRNPSNTPGQPSFGPSSLLNAGRTNSGRRNLGPGGTLSEASSRTGTPPAVKDSQKKEDGDTSSKNAFR